MKRKGKDGGTNVVEHAPTDHTSLLAQPQARELRCSIETCRMITRAGEAARFTFLIHSHMLRHSCGYKLANDGHDTRPSSPK
jgi:site-specific recombinase XerD